MAKRPLQERIQAALKPPARLADIRSTIDEVEAEIVRAREALRQAERRSEDPTLSDDVAMGAESEAEALRLTVRRLDRALKDLEEVRAAKEEDERYQAARAEYESAKAERNKLDAELRERVPALFAELVSLNERIIASDCRISQANRQSPQGCDRLVSAEVTARGAVNEAYWHDHESLLRLTDLKLPNFARPGLLWPPKDEALIAAFETAANLSARRAEAEIDAGIDRARALLGSGG